MRLWSRALQALENHHLLRSTALLAAPAAAALAGLVVVGAMPIGPALATAVVLVAALAGMLGRHFREMAALRHYVESLRTALDKDSALPDLPRVTSPGIDPELPAAIAESARERQARRRELRAAISGNEALFAGLPDHPQQSRAQHDDHGRLHVQLSSLRPYLCKSKVFLEIGAGDCRLSLAVSKLVHRAVAIDAGHFSRWVLDAVEVPSPDRFVWTVDFASIGQGVPAGNGAAVGSDAAATVAFCGDAGCMMSLQEIETAARHDLPVTFVVFNDEALGAELHSMLTTAFDGAETAEIEAPEFADVAESLGARGETVRSVDDLRAIGDGIVPEGGPLVVDCKVDPSVRHPNQFD
jgi:hypothetical protein